MAREPELLRFEQDGAGLRATLRRSDGHVALADRKAEPERPRRYFATRGLDRRALAES